MKSWFCTKPPRVSYKTVKDSHFSMKPFFKFRSEEKGYSRGYTGRKIKGSVELKIRFLSILTHFETFSVYGTFSPGFVKNLYFLECSSKLIDNFNIIIQSEENKFLVKNRYMESTLEWQKSVFNAIENRRWCMI